MAPDTGEGATKPGNVSIVINTVTDPLMRTHEVLWGRVCSCQAFWSNLMLISHWVRFLRMAKWCSRLLQGYCYQPHQCSRIFNPVEGWLQVSDLGGLLLLVYTCSSPRYRFVDILMYYLCIYLCIYTYEYNHAPISKTLQQSQLSEKQGSNCLKHTALPHLKYDYWTLLTLGSATSCNQNQN